VVDLYQRELSKVKFGSGSEKKYLSTFILGKKEKSYSQRERGKVKNNFPGSENYQIKF